MFKSKRRKFLLGKKGVTLVECIVAVAMLAIIGLMAYTMFSTGFTNIQRGNEDIKSAADSTVVLVSQTKPSGYEGTLTEERGTYTFKFQTPDGTYQELAVTGTYYTYTDAHGNEYVTFVPDED